MTNAGYFYLGTPKNPTENYVGASFSGQYAKLHKGQIHLYGYSRYKKYNGKIDKKQMIEDLKRGSKELDKVYATYVWSFYKLNSPKCPVTIERTEKGYEIKS